MDECKRYEMKIFNEDLEKHLLYDELNEFLTYELPATLVFWGIFLTIAFIFGNIVFNVLANYSLSDFSQLIIVLCETIVLLCISQYIIKFVNKIFKPSIIPSNPTLNKLKNVAKQKDRVNLVKLWKHFNPDHPSDSIVLGQNQKDIELLQKLDDDLVRFIENADDITIKLFKLDDFESYKQLYMKYIAPKQKEEVLNKIQTLTEKLLNQSERLENQEGHLVNQLQLLKNEIDTYAVNTADYFEFKKWYKETLDMLKLDKDNDMVKSNYQNIIQEINNSQKED